MNSSIIKRFLRFFAVGGSGVLVNMGVLILLTEGLTVPYAISSLVAIELSILSNFALNNGWTWSDRRTSPLGERLVKYHLVAGFSALAGNWCLLVMLASVFQVDYRLANLAGIAAGVVLNFVLNHRWTFREPGRGGLSFRWNWLTSDWGGRSLHEMAPRGAVAILALLAVALGLRVAAMTGMVLVPEEAYYWMYSQHPSMSYYDHPPMVAWLIGAGTQLFGQNQFGVRIGGALLMLASSGLMYAFGRAWFGRAAGLGAAILLQILPVYFGVGLIATMDSALVFFWLVALLGVTVALKGCRAWGWYVAGLGLGGAMLSKYTGVFLGLGALLAVVGYPPWRRHLRTVHPYLAVLLAFAMFCPVVVWNAQHDWASFRFQFTERFADQKFNLGSIASFAGLQLVVATPLVLVGLAWLYFRSAGNRRRLLTPRWLVAVGFSLPLLVVMSYKSLRYDIHLNWTLPAYLSALPAVVRLGLVLWRCGRKRTSKLRLAWPRAALATAAGCAGVNVLLLVYVLAVQPRTGWISALGPWRELATAVEAVEEQLEHETGMEPLIVGEGKYRLASVLAFYRTPLEHKVRASDFTTSQWIVGGRGLGFPYWAKPWRGADCILVNTGHDVSRFASRFQQFAIVREVRLAGAKDYQIAIGRGRRE